MKDDPVGTEQAHKRRVRLLVFQRWADLGFLFVFSVALGFMLSPFLERVQLTVAEFLCPWGWFIGAFVGLVAATSAWTILGNFGVSFRLPIPNRLWMTNPPAWPVAIIVFLLCSFLWQCVVGPQKTGLVAFSLQAGGAVALLLFGRLSACSVAWLRKEHTCHSASVGVTQGDFHDLADLADHPEQIIEWLKREEPINDPRQDCFDMAPYARRIADALRSTPMKTVALIGPYGCGKSSIAKMVQCYLSENGAESKAASPNGLGDRTVYRPPDIIVAEVSGWGFREGTVVEHILGGIVDAMSQRMDCLEISTIPSRYQRMLSGSGAWLHALCALVDAPADCAAILQRIDKLLLRSNMRAVTFLEDVDRNVQGQVFLNEVASLLESLKGLENISFVLAIGEEYQGQDIAAKLGEHIEIVPPPAWQPILRVLRFLREYLLKRYPNDIDVLTSEEREERARFAPSDPIDRIAEAGFIQRPIDAPVRLLTSPRIVKTSLRRTWFAWERLHGEIDFDDLLVCNVLRAAAPQAYVLLNENVARLRAISGRAETSEAQKRNDESRKQFASLLEDRGKDAEWDIDAVHAVVEFLFPGFRGRHAFHRLVDTPQGVNVGEPTDYWVRLNREEVGGRETRDQGVLLAIDEWKADKDSDVFQGHTMPNALLRIEGFADKIEQFGRRLDAEQVRELASGLFLLIRGSDVIGKGDDYPGFVQLWRLSLKKESKGHDDWVVGEISRALSRSLRFANDIYYYWRSNQARASFPTPEIRKRFVQAARRIYGNDPGTFVNALDPGFPYSTYHLVVLHASVKNGGPGLDKEDWLWFGPVLLTAASVKQEVVIPQIIVLLTDYDCDPFAEHRGAAFHKPDFDDSVAESVFGAPRMRELMQLLNSTPDTETTDSEMHSRLACCRRRAEEWLRGNPEHAPDSP